MARTKWGGQFIPCPRLLPRKVQALPPPEVKAVAAALDLLAIATAAVQSTLAAVVAAVEVAVDVAVAAVAGVGAVVAVAAVSAAATVGEVVAVVHSRRIGGVRRGPTTIHLSGGMENTVSRRPGKLWQLQQMCLVTRPFLHWSCLTMACH